MSAPEAEVSPGEYAALVRDARLWRALSESPHVAAILVEWAEWDRRRQLRQSSWDISTVHPPRFNPVTYAVLERRRNTYTTPARSAEEIRRQARQSWGLPA